ncbi:MAG: hypothetical protein ACK5IQ_09325 [Bacteroidales bacterium]
MRGASDEAISCNREQIASLTFAMTTDVDTTMWLLQAESLNQFSPWQRHGERHTTTPAQFRIAR